MSRLITPLVKAGWARFRVWHIRRGQKYHEGNSFRGIAAAERAGHEAIDIDVTLTRDWVAVGQHWQQPLRHGFRHPTRPNLRTNLRMRDMDWRLVRELRAPGGYRISEAHVLGNYAARSGVEPWFEVKPDPRWTISGAYRRNFHLGTHIMTLPRLGHTKRILRAAKQAGMVTVLLPRGPVPPTWWKHIDIVKTRRRAWVVGKPARVKWLRAGRIRGG